MLFEFNSRKLLGSFQLIFCDYVLYLEVFYQIQIFSCKAVRGVLILGGIKSKVSDTSSLGSHALFSIISGMFTHIR